MICHSKEGNGEEQNDNSPSGSSRNGTGLAGRHQRGQSPSIRHAARSAANSLLNRHENHPTVTSIVPPATPFSSSVLRYGRNRVSTSCEAIAVRSIDKISGRVPACFGENLIATQKLLKVSIAGKEIPSE